MSDALKVATAKRETQTAKRRLASTMGALQYRLRPANLANEAWEGLRDKSSAIADDAIATVRQRPAAASGIVAAVALFLVRDPIRNLLSGWLAKKDDIDPDVVTTRIDNEDNVFDLTAPTVERSPKEGAIA